MKTLFAKITYTGVILMMGLLMTSNPAEAQQRHRYGQEGNQKGAKLEKMEAQRIAFITQELNLTPEEAKAFWPVYNEFEAKRNELKKTFRSASDLQKAEIEKLSEKEASQILDNQIIESQKLLDLRKEYHAKFKSVLPAVKVLQLYDAERAFQKMLIERLRQNNPRSTGNQK